jgi:hypothetical protein
VYRFNFTLSDEDFGYNNALAVPDADGAKEVSAGVFNAAFDALKNNEDIEAAMDK